MISDQPFDFNYDPPPEIPPVEQSHLEPPPVEQSHLEPPPVEQSHFDPPPVEHSMVDSTQFGPPQSTSPPDYISSGVFNPDWHEGPAIGPLTQGQLEADKKSMEDRENYHRQLEEFLDHWSNHPPPEEGYEPTPPEPPLH
jgi:hypothetical protein